MSRGVWRVRGAGTFRELRRRGRRARAGDIVVTWLPEPTEGPPRLAFAIGRPVGSAVVRNRLRRRLRSVFAELAPAIRPGTYLIGAQPGAVTLEHGDLLRTVRALLNDLGGLTDLTRLP